MGPQRLLQVRNIAVYVLRICYTVVYMSDNPPLKAGVRRGAPRSVSVMVRLTEAGAAALDEIRADSPRSEFLRDLLVKEYARRSGSTAKRL